MADGLMMTLRMIMNQRQPQCHRSLARLRVIHYPNLLALKPHGAILGFRKQCRKIKQSQHVWQTRQERVRDEEPGAPQVPAEKEREPGEARTMRKGQVLTDQSENLQGLGMYISQRCHGVEMVE